MKNTDYKIYDAHAHIFPEKISQKASAAIGDFYGIPMRYDGTAKKLIEIGKSSNVCGFLVSSTATTVKQVVSINNFIAEKCAQNTCFVGFGSLHPDFMGFRDEIARIKELGLRGIKLHHDFQKFNIDDANSLPMYREIAAAGLPLLLHMGDDRYDYSHPFRLRNLLEKVPDLNVIASHFGGYRVWDCVEEYLDGTNVYFDTASTLSYIKKQQACDMIYHFGVDRFLFGTDFPMWDLGEELEKFLALELPVCDNIKILSGNFERLFIHANAD